MRQHGRQFGRRLSGVGLMKVHATKTSPKLSKYKVKFSSTNLPQVEMDGISEAGNEAGGSDPIDKAIVKKELTASNHILSEAFRVIVEVPDPPKQSGGFAEEEEEEEEEEEKVGLTILYTRELPGVALVNSAISRISTIISIKLLEQSYFFLSQCMDAAHVCNHISKGRA